MAAVEPSAELRPGQVAVPVLWTVRTRTPATGDYSDAVLARLLPGGRGRSLKTFGHDPDGVHWLLTRGGTTLHYDPAYARYSHQLVVRNDGNRLRGLPRFEGDPATWHPPLVPGVMYALDTHSPHHGVPDPRMDPPPVVLKLCIAVDRDEPLSPAEAFPLLARYLAAKLPASLDEAARS
jgi:hypothetical protein